MPKISQRVQLFAIGNGQLQMEVEFGEEIAWLSLHQMARLLERDKSVISRHIRDLFA